MIGSLEKIMWVGDRSVIVWVELKLWKALEETSIEQK